MVFASVLLVFASENNTSSDLYYDLYSFSEIDNEGSIDDRIIIDFDTLPFVSFYEQLQDDEELLVQFLEAQIIAERQLPAQKTYSDLMIAFMNDYGDFAYPEHYAGAFLDYDTLVIQVTDMSPHVIAFYTNLLGSDAPISFAQVAFSFNRLRTYGEMFISSLDAPITSFGYDTRTNTFRIGLYYGSEYSSQTIESFNADGRFASPPITLEQESFAAEQVLQGGSQLSLTGGGMSVGITGSWVATMDALITTGHGFINRPVNTPVYIPNGTRIGYLHLFRSGPDHAGFPGTTHGDWAIVRLNDNGRRMMTNLTRCGTRIRGSVPFLPVNSVAHGTGFMSFAWSGTVSAVNQDVYSRGTDGVTRRRTGMTRADRGGANAPTGGDSGGTIFTSGGIFAGVHSSAGSRTELFRTIYHFHFSPIGHANHFSPSLQ